MVSDCAGRHCGEARRPIEESGRRRSAPAMVSVLEMPSVFAQHVGASRSSVLSASASASSSRIPAQAASSVSIFSQVHAFRHSQSSRAIAQQSRPSDEPAQASPARPFHGHGTSCTVCLDEFGPGDHICRMACGHMFHAICVGEMALHGSATDTDGDIAIECPNCRSSTQVQRSFRYPSESQTQPQMEEQPRARPDDASPDVVSSASHHAAYLTNATAG